MFVCISKRNERCLCLYSSFSCYNTLLYLLQLRLKVVNKIIIITQFTVGYLEYILFCIISMYFTFLLILSF